MLKKNAFLVLISLAILLLIGLTPSVALASNPLGITLTPTEEATATPEEPTATPLPPTPTGPVQPPESSPTPTSQLATPPAPTETPEPEEPEEPEPTRPAPVLPETGQGPLNPSISWTGLFAALGFALIGTLVFRALFRSRMLE
jgi:hypothetical protein